MTRLRNDGHSTEFGLWVRGQLPDQKISVACIDSRKSTVEAYTASNIDFMWMDYKSGKWMIIEEKRYKQSLTTSQQLMYPVIHAACLHDKNYQGFFVIKFEKTNPEDGDCFVYRMDVVNGKSKLEGGKVSINELLDFLQFKHELQKEAA